MRNIHKYNALAAGIAMAVSTGANAGAIGAANEIVIGGATAPQNFMREDLMIRMCDPALAPVRVFVDNVAVAPSTTPGGNIMSQGDHFVVHCTVRNDGTFNAPLAGADIAVYKLNGGSATGVAPVVDPVNAAPNAKTYLDPSVAGCNAYSAGGGSGPAGNQYPIGSTGGLFELYECPDPNLLVVQDPDAGVSDVEPTLFTGPLALDFGAEPFGVVDKPTQPFVDQGNLNIKPGPGLIFGTIVSLPLYDELSRDQYAAGMLAECDALIGDGNAATPPTTAEWDAATRAQLDTEACMPSLPQGVIRSVFLGQVTDWDKVAPYGLPLDTTAVQQANTVHICKRTNGSGTHAQFSVNFLGTNCRAASNLAMSEHNDGVSFAGAGFVGVYANRGSSDMSDCLDALGNGLGFNGDFGALPQVVGDPTGDSSVVPGSALDPAAGIVQTTAFGNHPLGVTYDNGGVAFTAFGMGYNSLENNTALTFDYRFVKVDGVSPTLENTIAGEYRDVYYLSYQHRHNGDSTTPDLRTGAIRTVPATPAQVAVADEYFRVWNATAPAAIKAVNDGLIVNPDGVLGNADDWQGGYVSPIAGAALSYDGVNPATPWSRQSLSGAADSCQDLGLVR